MELISREEAKSKGLKRFYTGKECIHGHLSERHVSSGTCYLCHRVGAISKLKNDPEFARKAREGSARWNKENPEKKIISDRSWRDRNLDKLRTVKGLPLPGRVMPEVCECCHLPEVRVGRYGKVLRLSLDHDHSTGEFTGWLCSNCNNAKGFLGDNRQGAQNLLNYYDMVEGKE